MWYDLPNPHFQEIPKILPCDPILTADPPRLAELSDQSESSRLVLRNMPIFQYHCNTKLFTRYDFRHRQYRMKIW